MKRIISGKEVVAVRVPFRAVKEDWQEYLLEDGRTIRVRCIAKEFVEAVTEKDLSGCPLFNMEFGFVVSLVDPKE